MANKNNNKNNNENYNENTNKKLEKATQREFGKFLIDIAKYVITAVIVSSFFKSFGNGWQIYIFGALLTGILIAFGFWYLNISNRTI